MKSLKQAIREFIEAKEAGFRSQATIARYLDILEAFAEQAGEDRSLTDIAPEDVRHFLSQKRKQGLKPASIDTYYRTLLAFWNWAAAEYGLSSSPMRRVEKPCVPKKMPPRLTEKEMSRLLRAATASREPERNRAILLLLFDSGIRAGELVSLQVKNVDFKGRLLHVIGKDKEERVIPLGDITLRALEEYLDRRIEDHDAPLFLSARTGSSLTVSGLRQMIKRLARAAGIKRSVYPHLIRHSFAYAWMKEGGSLEKLRQIMGHSRLETTSIYAKALQEDVEEEHRKLQPAEKIARKALQFSLLE